MGINIWPHALGVFSPQADFLRTGWAKFCSGRDRFAAAVAASVSYVDRPPQDVLLMGDFAAPNQHQQLLELLAERPLDGIALRWSGDLRVGVNTSSGRIAVRAYDRPLLGELPSPVVRSEDYGLTGLLGVFDVGTNQNYSGRYAFDVSHHAGTDGGVASNRQLPARIGLSGTQVRVYFEIAHYRQVIGDLLEQGSIDDVRGVIDVVRLLIGQLKTLSLISQEEWQAFFDLLNASELDFAVLTRELDNLLAQLKKENKRIKNIHEGVGDIDEIRFIAEG